MMVDKNLIGHFGGNHYETQVLKIDNLTEVKEFYEKIAHLPTEVILRRGNFQCDASSLLGIFALDTSIPFEIVYDATETEFSSYILKFKV